MSKDLNYKGRCIKMHDDTWEILKRGREKSGLSWNLYILKLHGKSKPYKKTVDNKYKVKNKEV